MEEEKPKIKIGKKKIEMMNKNSVWVRTDTALNIITIRKFLKKREKEKGRKTRHSYSDLSRRTGINRKAVSHACYIMTFKKEPELRMWCERIFSKTQFTEDGKRKLSTTMKVRRL